MEVPVVVPLQVPSVDARRRQTYDEEEEIDIGASMAAPSPLIQNRNPLGLSTSPGVPSGGNFHTERANDSGYDAVQIQALSGSSQTINYGDDETSLHATLESLQQPRRGTSHELKRKNVGNSGGSRKRGNSFSATFFGGDDAEGDLGYAAASDMENATRKVIVERLETVKANNPVFSWC